MEILLCQCDTGWTARFRHIPGLPEDRDIALPFTRDEALPIVADDLARSFPLARVYHRQCPQHATLRG